jgi:hypothetical protein
MDVTRLRRRLHRTQAKVTGIDIFNREIASAERSVRYDTAISVTTRARC